MPNRNLHQQLSEEATQALHRKNYKILATLVDLNTINAVDSKGRSLLAYAVNYSDLMMLDWLLARNPDLNIQDNSGWTPLHFAAQKYALEMVEHLLNAGAEVDIKDNYGNTALWRAVFESRGRGDVIKLLLARNADADLKNDSGISPRGLAATIANFDVKQYFLHEL